MNMQEQAITMEIMMASDEDSYKIIWIDGERELDGKSIYICDVLHLLSNKINKKPLSKIIFRDYKLYDASVSDIPINIKTFEDLESWYLDFTGEEIDG